MSKAEKELLEAEEQYNLMEEEDKTEASSAVIIICAVVVLGLIGSIMFMRYMLNQSKMKLVEKANERHQKIRDLTEANEENKAIHAKMK